MTQRFESEAATIERDTYRHDGLELAAWIIRPRGPGPFPMLVVNHGSGLVVQSDGTLDGTPERPTVDPTQPAWFDMARSGWVFLVPEGRGYGGSEGPDPRRAATSPGGAMAMLHGRAADANAAIDWALGRGLDTDPGRIAITGGSHGGVVTLLAAAQRPFAAAVPQAVGAAYGHAEFGAVALANAAARIRCPVLFQHMRSDTLVWPEGAHRIWQWSHRFRPQQEWRDYPGVPGVQGHFMFDPANRPQWFPDYRAFLHAAFALPGPMPAPEDAPERMTDATLPFALPDIAPTARRWTGRFGTGPGSVATMLVLDGDAAVYAWVQSGSRGYAHATVRRHGDTIVLAPWPGTTVTYAPAPDGGFLATYAAGSARDTAAMRPDPPG